MAEKKIEAKARVSKGDRYVCDVCGLAVTVDVPCECVDCSIICCGKPMKVKKIPVK
jgi:hypothetical protein